MSVNSPKLKNASLAYLLLISTSLLGCTNITNQPAPRILDIDSTSFAKYWVAKDKLIHWQKSLHTTSEVDIELTGTQYLVSFVVDSDGQMQQLEIINSTTGELLDKARTAKASEQQFHPTVQNSSHQAVRISTSFRL
ncbi:energy transducer TonB [Shewanella sp. KX20019]|uniref:energy transducer TonB n=1 Tax=Shewanella sp. KX20019 TaxID=2803864 RepID=UPI001925D334|nr:energy transducer TonB [Shewanella sp. KX20019]QQX79844.1 energy transducer TonB [Shewanella sp. KX20019]